MLRVAVAKLHSKDGSKLYLQRRNSTTPLFPYGLSFFGGQIEKNEGADDAIKRELGEETLGLSGVVLTPITSLAVLPPATGTNEPVEVHLFEGVVDDIGFTATEGADVEVMTYEEARSHPDLVPTTRYILNQLEDKNGAIDN